MIKKVVLLSALLVLLLAACSGGAGQAEADATAIVRDFYAAIHDEKVDTAMSFVAEDAQFINPTGTYIGKEQVRSNLDALAEANLSFELRELTDTGGFVSYSYTTYIDGEAVEEGTDGVTIVRDGKIIFDGTQSTVPDSLRP